MKPSIFLNELIDLKHMKTLEKMPFEAQHKIFKRLAEIADSKTLTKGRAEGRAEGKKEKAKEIALNLLAYHTPIEVIAKTTGLTIEEVKKLKP